MKISLITTVFNEEKSIRSFLESIIAQTKLPDEIVMVDAGSNDQTFKIISHFPFPISKNKVKIILKKGNRSIGRNTAIDNANNEIIAVTDAGCILDKNWLLEITNPFKGNKNIDVISGFYKPMYKNIFQKCLATYTSVMEDKIDGNNFIPSSRSVAFKKSIFKKVNGYPEFLNTCEDLVFDKNLKKINAIFYFNKKALVYWPQRKNLFSAAKQFFSYAYGDGRAFYFRKSTPFLFLRYVVALILLIVLVKFHILALFILYILGIILYITWAISKNYKYVKDIRAFIYLPTLQIISDFMVMGGVISGIISRLNLRN